MKFRKIFFSKLLPKRVIKVFLDNLIYFSDFTLEEYFKSLTLRRRNQLLKNSLLSIGVGYRNSDPNKNETWLISSLFLNIFNKDEKLILFDVGANIGFYSELLLTNFTKSIIYAFEPNPITFDLLKKRKIGENKNFRCLNLGLSNESIETVIYTYSNDLIAGQASLSKDVFKILHNSDDLTFYDVKLVTLNEFCKNENVKNIDLLKIDTEGFEFEVLIGASDLLKKGRISVIQFEFNEMNVVKRRFLKDFYELLEDYYFFRISFGELIDISVYKSEYEIFWYQDILCILKSEKKILDQVCKYVIK